MTDADVDELRDRARLYCTEPAQTEAWRQAFELGYLQGHTDAQADRQDQRPRETTT